MSVTKNIRDGRLFLIGGQPGARLASWAPSTVYQDGLYYRFENFVSGGTYRLRRSISKNVLDFNSIAPTQVLVFGSSPIIDIHIVREADAIWRCYFALDAGSSHYSIYVCTSTDQGATWGTPVEIIPYGESWSVVAVRSPSVATFGGRRVMVCVGDSDKMGVYYCANADDPEDDAEWTEATGNPIYDSPYSNLTPSIIAGQDGRLYVYWTEDATAGGDRRYQYVSEILVDGTTYTLVGKRRVATYGSGASNEFVRGDSLYDPMLGLYVHSRVVANAPNPFTAVWVSERPDSAWIPVSSVSPGVWPEGKFLELEIPDGGLTLTEDAGDVKVVMNRTGPDHLLRGKFALSGSLSFKPFDYESVVDQLRDGLLRGQMGDMQTTHIVLMIADETGAPDEFIQLPFSVVKPSFTESSEANGMSLDISCPLGIPLVGKMNSGAFGAGQNLDYTA